MKIVRIALMLLLGTLALGASAQQSDSLPLAQPEKVEAKSLQLLWDEANTAYLRSDFRSAIRTYEQILEQGYLSPKLYYNLGNAYFKDEQHGRAILNYHRALRLKPGDEDIRHNLSVAERHTVDRINEIPEFFLKAWMRDIRSIWSGTVWTLLSIALVAIALTALILYLLSERIALRKAGFFTTLTAGVLFVLCTLFAAADRREQLSREQAVILSGAVSVKSSPNKSATDLFVLHEGTTLRLGESYGEWQEITLADGKKGWLEAKHIEAI